MIIQTILEIRRLYEIKELKNLIEKTIEAEELQAEKIKKYNGYVNPSKLRLGDPIKQTYILKIEPANYCPI